MQATKSCWCGSRANHTHDRIKHYFERTEWYREILYIASIDPNAGKFYVQSFDGKRGQFLNMNHSYQLSVVSSKLVESFNTIMKGNPTEIDMTYSSAGEPSTLGGMENTLGSIIEFYKALRKFYDIPRADTIEAVDLLSKRVDKVKIHDQFVGEIIEHPIEFGNPMIIAQIDEAGRISVYEKERDQKKRGVNITNTKNWREILLKNVCDHIREENANGRFVEFIPEAIKYRSPYSSCIEEYFGYQSLAYSLEIRRRINLIKK